MRPTIKYVVFELNSLLNSNNLTLEKYQFDDWVSNSFNTEEEAIEALIKEDRTYCNFYILKQVYLE